MPNTFYETMGSRIKGTAFAWNETGTKLLVLIQTGRLQLYDTTTGKIEIEIAFPDDPVYAIAWNPAGIRGPGWIAGTERGSVHEISETGSFHDPLFVEDGEIHAVAISTRGSSAIIACNVACEEITTRDLKSRAMIGQLELDWKQPVDKIAWNTIENELVASINFRAMSLDATCKLKNPVPGIDGDVIVFSPDGKRLLGIDDMNLVVLEVPGWKPVLTMRCDMPRAAGKDAPDDGENDEDPEIEVHEHVPVDEAERVSAACWSPDGRFLVGCTSHGEVHVFRSRDGKHLHFLGDRGERYDPVIAAGWSPDGKHVVVSWGSSAMQSWDVQQWLIDNDFLVQCPGCKQVIDVDAGDPRGGTCPACKTTLKPARAGPINDATVLKELKEAGFRLERASHLLDLIPAEFRRKDSPPHVQQQDGFVEEGGRVVGLSTWMSRPGSPVKFPASMRFLTALRVLKLYQAIPEIPEEIWLLGKLENLVIAGCKIQRLSPDIEKLHDLRVLVAGKNELQDVPDSIGNLHALEFLILEGNPLKSIPESIRGAIALRHLNLKYTQLATLPDALCDLVNLEVLEISSPDLEFLPENIGRLRSLKTLFIECPKLKRIPASIGLCEHLEWLLIVTTSEITEIPATIGGCKQLKKLVVQGKVKALPRVINTLKQLEVVSVEGEIEDLADDVFQGLDQLHMLWLSSNRLSRLPASMVTLRSLRILKVDQNKFVEIPPVLSSLLGLKELHMAQNKIDVLPEFLLGMQLGTLNVANNPLEQLDVTSFSKLKARINRVIISPKRI